MHHSIKLANCSLQHAQQAFINGFRWPSKSNIVNHSIKDILEESLEHEMHALNLYKKLLTKVEGESVYLEEYTRDWARRTASTRTPQDVKRL